MAYGKMTCLMPKYIACHNNNKIKIFNCFPTYFLKILMVAINSMNKNRSVLKIGEYLFQSILNMN